MFDAQVRCEGWVHAACVPVDWADAVRDPNFHCADCGPRGDEDLDVHDEEEEDEESEVADEDFDEERPSQNMLLPGWSYLRPYQIDAAEKVMAAASEQGTAGQNNGVQTVHGGTWSSKSFT